MMPKVGWFGDDFTGASDTLATYAEAGISAALLTRLPSPGQLRRLGPVTALGLAGKTRALDAAGIRAALAPVGPFFAGLGVRILHYKCCSTFDSAPETGNFSVAVNALRGRFPTPTLPVIGGQPNLRRYCLFGHLFAAAGQTGAVHRIDRHPTMSRHPVTPMGEADLVLHLGRQGFGPISAIAYPDIAAGDAPRLLDEATGRGDDAVLFDVSRTEDLPVIGSLLWRISQTDPVLALGASSVAQALIPGLPASPATPGSQRGAPGPAFVLVGSLSPVTRAQVGLAATYEKHDIEPERLAGEPGYADALAARLITTLRAGRPVMAVTCAARTDAVSSHAVATATAALAIAVLRAGLTRKACIAGGDTSSFFMSSIDGWALRHRGSVGSGSPICELSSDDPALDGLHVVLKGGQMGEPDVFERFAAWG